MMGLLKSFAGTHAAQKFYPRHDGMLHLLEARRGRGKSYALLVLMYQISVSQIKRWDDKYPFRVVTNFKVDKQRFARMLVQDKHFSDYLTARKAVERLIVYATHIDDYLLAYNSLLIMDECNRMFDVYKMGKERTSPAIHDWLQQSRKSKVTAYFATQFAEWVDTKARMLLDLMHRARVVKKTDPKTKERHPEEFWYYGADPFANGAGKEMVRRADYKFSLKFQMKFARMYHSWEPIITVDMNTRFQSYHEIAEYQLKNGLRPPHDRGYRIWADAVDQLADLERALELQMGARGDAPAPRATSAARNALDMSPIPWPADCLSDMPYLMPYDVEIESISSAAD